MLINSTSPRRRPPWQVATKSRAQRAKRTLIQNRLMQRLQRILLMHPIRLMSQMRLLHPMLLTMRRMRPMMAWTRQRRLTRPLSVQQTIARTQTLLTAPRTRLKQKRLQTAQLQTRPTAVRKKTNLGQRTRQHQPISQLQAFQARSRTRKTKSKKILLSSSIQYK